MGHVVKRRSPCRRTEIHALKEWYPVPIDERTVSCCWAHTFHAVDWEALESSSPVLQAGARPSQLPIRVLMLLQTTKKARRRGDPGLCVIRKMTAKCHKRNGRTKSVFASR